MSPLSNTNGQACLDETGVTHAAAVSEPTTAVEMRRETEYSGVANGDGDDRNARRNDQNARSSTSARLIRSGVVVTVLRIAGIGAMALTTAMLGRLLSPREFGQFVLLTSLATFGSLVSLTGLNRSLVRFAAESLGVNDPRRAVRAVRLGMGIGLASITVCSMIAGGLLYFCGNQLFGFGGLTVVAPLTALWLALMSAHALIGEALRGFHHQFYASVFSGATGGPLANVLFLAVFPLSVLVFPASLELTLAVNVSIMLLISPLAVYWLVRSVRKSELVAADLAVSGPTAPLPPLTTRIILGVSFALMLVQALYFLATQGDLWIAGLLLRPDDLAHYGAARRLVPLLTMPLQLGSLAVAPTIGTLYAQGRHQELQSVLQRVATTCFLVSLLPMVAIFMAPGRCLNLYLGGTYASAASVLVVLCAGQMVLSWSGTHGWVLMMTGHQKPLLWFTAIICLALFVGGALATRQWGAMGLASVAAAATAVQSVGSVLLAKRLTGIWSCVGWQRSSVTAAKYHEA